MKNYYQILEIEPDARPDKIREQYLFLVQAWHPDKFSNPAHKTKAEEKTKEINAAYEILGNPVKRAEYDRTTHSSQPKQEQGYRRQGGAQAAHPREDALRNRRSAMKSAKAASTSIRVFMNGQERILNVEDLVKASVQYFDEATKEDMGIDFFRTHAAVRAAVSRCIKCGVEIHVRELAR